VFLVVGRRLTYANVVLTFALVFAMSGGAFAAKRYLITSNKQISPKVLKSLQGMAGKPGANGVSGSQGAAGAVGAVGPAGPQGPAGPKGENGLEGVSVTGTESRAKIGPCKEGGSEFKTASAVTFACNGEKGKEGPAGPLLEALPAGKTLRGAWAATGFGEAGFPNPGVGKVKTAVSFVFPLSFEPARHYIAKGEGAGEGKEAPSIVSGECTGNSEKPGAAEGQLCVFGEDEENILAHTPSIFIKGNPGAAYGFAVGAVSENKGTLEMDGTWAVTAK